MTPLLIALLGSSALFMAFLGARSLLVQRQTISRRLRDIRSASASNRAEPDYVTAKPLPPLWRGVAFLGWALPHLMTSEDVAWDLLQAGYRRREARGLYAGSKVFTCAILGSGLLFAATCAHLPQSQVALLVFGAALVGYFLPNGWISYRQGHRRNEISHALPDALDLMVICVEAGQGLNAAILKVAREIVRHSPVLSEELQQVNQEIRIGSNRAQALRNFAARSGVDEVRSLAAVLIQSDRLGTSVARALRVHAQSLRTRRRQRAEEAARKTAVKLVFPLVLCIFPGLLVVILAPAMLQLLHVLADSTQR